MHGGVEEVFRGVQLIELYALWQILSHLLNTRVNLVDDLCGVRACRLIHHEQRAVVPVGHAFVVVRLVAQLDACHVLQAQYLTRGQRLDDHVTELFRRDKAALVLHRVLEHAFIVLAERAGGGLDVLRIECRSHIRGYNAILRHHVRLQPDTHTVVGSEQRYFAHTRDTLQLGDDVNLQVVVQELVVIAVIGAPQGDGFQHRLLLLVGDDTDARYV